MGSGAGSHHFAAILQVGNYYKTSCQHTHCDYAIHVVQSKHQHVFVQYHWFTGRLDENHAVRIWEINAGSKFAPSHCYTSQAVNDNEATYQYRHYANAIHVVQRKHQHLFLQHPVYTARWGENTCS